MKNNYRNSEEQQGKKKEKGKTKLQLKSYARRGRRESELANDSIFKAAADIFKDVQFRKVYGRVTVAPFLGRFHTCKGCVVAFSS